jgi:hypothetical protein
MFRNRLVTKPRARRHLATKTACKPLGIVKTRDLSSYAKTLMGCLQKADFEVLFDIYNSKSVVTSNAETSCCLWKECCVLAA